MKPRRSPAVVLAHTGAVLAGVALLAGCSAAAGGPGATAPSASVSASSTVADGGSTADRSDSATETANAQAIERLFADAFPDPSSSAALSTAGDLVAADAVAHGDGASGGPQGLLDQFAAAHERVSGAHAVIKHIAADGDLVAVHWQLASDPADERTGEAAVDLFRIVGGRIVERWSLAQPIAEGTPASGNTNTVFSDLYEGDGSAAPDEKQEEKNRELAVGAYDRLFRDQDVSVLDDAFDPAYLQHNPVAPNGTAALKGLFSGGASFPPQESVISLADGDLVWTFSRSVGAGDDSPILAADIFRVDGGLIREHWDVVPTAPAN